MGHWIEGEFGDQIMSFGGWVKSNFEYEGRRDLFIPLLVHKPNVGVYIVRPVRKEGMVSRWIRVLSISAPLIPPIPRSQKTSCYYERGNSGRHRRFHGSRNIRHGLMGSWSPYMPILGRAALLPASIYTQVISITMTHT